MQSAELVALDLSILLFIAHLAAQIVTQRRELSDDYLMGARDAERPLTDVTANRAKRALANFLENYPAFIAAALALVATGRTGGLGSAGAILWIIARIIYLPVYLAGTPLVRTLCWGAGIIALLLMLARLVF